MKPCLHPSLVDTNELEAYLDLAVQCGYEWVDVPLHWLHQEVEKTTPSRVEVMFQSRRLRLASFGLPVDLYADEADYVRDLALLPERVAFAVGLGAVRCTTFLWPSIDERPVPYASRLARRLRQCAVALMPHGVRMGLEYVGPHHLRNRAYPFVQNLAELAIFLEAVGAPNVGFLIDSFHWYTAEESTDDLVALKPEQIVHVHVNDAIEEPSLAHDQRRCLPGDGRIPLAPFLRALYEAGYRGPVSTEVLHQEPLAGSNEERAQAAFERLTQMIANVKGDC
ncbi:xylose isomerase [Alicyclobacillus tengchongensis]|nr:xylose isomerase [Alicyclobacillus tengchongensis]